MDRNPGMPGADPLHGYVNVSELDVPRRMEVFVEALHRRGYQADVGEKILGGNFARVLGTLCG